MKLNTWIVVPLLFVGSASVTFAATTSTLGDGTVRGRVHTDQVVYVQNGKMTIVHEIENGSSESVSYSDVNKRVFTACIDPIVSSPVPVPSVCSELKETGAQYIAAGQTDSFATGVISLKDVPPGFYRLWISAPQFKGLTSGKQLYVGAGTAIRIAPSTELAQKQYAISPWLPKYQYSTTNMPIKLYYRMQNFSEVPIQFTSDVKINWLVTGTTSTGNNFTKLGQVLVTPGPSTTVPFTFFPHFDSVQLVSDYLNRVELTIPAGKYTYSLTFEDSQSGKVLYGGNTPLEVN